MPSHSAPEPRWNAQARQYEIKVTVPGESKRRTLRDHNKDALLEKYDDVMTTARLELESDDTEAANFADRVALKLMTSQTFIDGLANRLAISLQKGDLASPMLPDA